VSKKRRVRGSKYTDAFKRQLVAKSYGVGVTVPMVSKKHGVPASRIYSWRGDMRFQTSEVEMPGFTSIEVSDGPALAGIAPPHSAARIEMTLENGRRLSISDDVEASFVLELARADHRRRPLCRGGGLSRQRHGVF
jgi:transposase